MIDRKKQKSHRADGLTNDEYARCIHISIVHANEPKVHGELTKVASHLFGTSEMDFWRDVRGDIYMTSEQLGRALGYSNPQISVLNIFNRNRERLEPISVLINLVSTDEKTYNTRLFNEKGIYEIIRKSGQPKADQFYDWVYEVLQAIRKTGTYSIKPALDERQARVELFKTAIEHEERLATVEQRIEQVERKVTLDHAEQQLVRRTVSKRVYEFATNDNRRELFSQLYREIKDRWGVASYRDVRRVELQEVLDYVRAWKPRMQLVG